jgi:hypothetical protein
MSIVHQQKLTCTCGTPLEVNQAETVNAVLQPHFRQAILDREFHRYLCQVCGRTIELDVKFSYLDWDRRQFFVVVPVADLPRADELVPGVKELYERIFFRAPPGVKQVGSELMVRLVFGMEELREKIVLDEARLSDLILEAVKMQVMAGSPELRAARVVSLMLDSVASDGTLVFRPYPTQTFAGYTSVSPDLYAAVTARLEEVQRELKPRICNGPHVSLLRILGKAGLSVSRIT